MKLTERDKDYLVLTQRMEDNIYLCIYRFKLNCDDDSLTSVINAMVGDGHIDGDSYFNSLAVLTSSGYIKSNIKDEDDVKNIEFIELSVKGLTSKGKLYARKLSLTNKMKYRTNEQLKALDAKSKKFVESNIVQAAVAIAGIASIVGIVYSFFS